jgi:hypothetical protein
MLAHKGENMNKKLIWIYKHEGDSIAATVNEKALLDAAVSIYQTAFDHSATRQRCLEMFHGVYEHSSVYSMNENGEVVCASLEDDAPALVTTCRAMKTKDGYMIATNGMDAIFLAND